MVKYSDSFKLKLVTAYLKGSLGYNQLAKQYAIPDPKTIRHWVRVYKTQGTAGLTRKTRKTVYSVQFKLDRIQFMLDTGASSLDTAVQFNLNNPSLILRWMKAFRKQG